MNKNVCIFLTVGSFWLSVGILAAASALGHQWLGVLIIAIFTGMALRWAIQTHRITVAAYGHRRDTHRWWQNRY